MSNEVDEEKIQKLYENFIPEEICFYSECNNTTQAIVDNAILQDQKIKIMGVSKNLFKQIKLSQIDGKYELNLLT